MKFSRLLNQARLLLYISGVIFLFTSGCEKNNTNIVDKASASKDSVALLEAKFGTFFYEKYNAAIAKIVEGKFGKSGDSLFACFLKKNSNEEKTLFVAFIDSSNISKKSGIIYVTPLLEGDPEKLQTSTLSNDSTNDVIYYDSGDYLMGTGGGEIFYYIIDCAGKQTYSAHFIADKERGFNLFIAPHSNKAWIDKYFLDKVKSSYSPIKLLKKDIEY